MKIKTMTDVLVKFDEFNEKGDILATPEDKSIFKYLMDHNVMFVPIKGGQIKLRPTKYMNDLHPNMYMGKYGKCIFEIKRFEYPKGGTSEMLTSIIIYLNHIDIV